LVSVTSLIYISISLVDEQAVIKRANVEIIYFFMGIL
jgi:hypothetical protein